MDIPGEHLHKWSESNNGVAIQPGWFKVCRDGESVLAANLGGALHFLAAAVLTDKDAFIVDNTGAVHRGIKAAGGIF